MEVLISVICPVIKVVQVRSETESEIAQTPLIIPDLAPTREDLDDSQTDESAKTSDSNDNDDDTTTSTSTDSDDGDTTENNAGDNSDDAQEDNDDGKDSVDERSSMIPFP